MILVHKYMAVPVNLCSLTACYSRAFYIMSIVFVLCAIDSTSVSLHLFTSGR